MYTLANGKVYINGKFEYKNIVIDNGTIVSIGNEIKGDVIDCKSQIIAPAFMDPHVHMREPGFEHKGTIKTESLAASHGGYTLCYLMPNVKPAPATRDSILKINEIINRDSKIELIQIGSITKDQSGKGFELSDMEDISDLVCGYSDDGNGVVEAVTMQEAMERASKLNKPIISHSEDKGLVKKGVVCLGEYGRINNLPMIDPVSEAVEVSRNALLAYKTGCHLHICHISSLDSLDIINFYKSKGANITCEVTPHQLTLTDMDIKDSNYKMNPPLQPEVVRLKLIEALKNGSISCIATDHAPHAFEEKQKGILDAPFGITGIETCFSVLYTKLVLNNDISLELLLDSLSLNVAKTFNINPNSIKIGNDANLVVIDLNKEFVVDIDFFYSKATNSPYIGEKLKGEISKTIYKGEIVYGK